MSPSADGRTATGAEGNPEPAASATEAALPALADHHCFGCSPRNAQGLRLRFRRHDDGIRARFRLDRHRESYPGVVHGGVTAAICDEAMGNLVLAGTGLPAFTVTMRIRYLSPLRVDTDYTCVARMRDQPQRTGRCYTEAEVVDDDGALLVSATGTYAHGTQAAWEES